MNASCALSPRKSLHDIFKVNVLTTTSAMPLYEYQCKKCHHRFEKIQKFSDRPMKKCPDCGGPLEQMISAPAVQFKGSGWYVTDYAKKSSASSASDGDSSSAKEVSAKDSSSKDGSKKEDKPKTEKKKSDKK
jgi:putative FmdB family regulatory protein